MRPDPKPPKRIVVAGITTKAVLANPTCQVCGGEAHTGHHIVSRSLGGDDVIENIGSVCGSGTTGCHGLLEALDRQACSQFRENMRPEQIRYVLEKKGQVFLDRYYPLPERVL